MTYFLVKYQMALWHLTVKHRAYKIPFCTVSVIEVTWHVCQSNTRPSRHLQNCGSLQKTRFNWEHFTDNCHGTHSLEIRAYLLLKWKRQESAPHWGVYKARWSPGLFWNNNKKIIIYGVLSLKSPRCLQKLTDAFIYHIHTYTQLLAHMHKHMPWSIL